MEIQLTRKDKLITIKLRKQTDVRKHLFGKIAKVQLKILRKPKRKPKKKINVRIEKEKVLWLKKIN